MAKTKVTYQSDAAYIGRKGGRVVANAMGWQIEQAKGVFYRGIKWEKVESKVVEKVGLPQGVEPVKKVKPVAKEQTNDTNINEQDTSEHGPADGQV